MPIGMDGMRSNRRRPEEIAAEIIRAASVGMPKTRIMYGARLNYKQLKRYLEGLTREGLIHSDYRGAIFASTEKGRAFLHSYDEVESLAGTLAEKEKAMYSFLRNDLERSET